MSTSFGTKWAVLFGAKDYQKVKPLRYSVKDIEKVEEVLRGKLGFREQNILKFADGTQHLPQYTSFWEDLNQFLRANPIGEDDLLMFYFSGHGQRHESTDYLMPLDAAPGTLTRSGIKVDDLINELVNTGCKNIVTFFDACRDVAAGAKGVAGFGAGTKSVSEGTGVVSFFSCEPTEQSWEIEALQQSSFTYCLVEGIQKGSLTTVGDMYDHLRQRVPALNDEHKLSPQKPWASILPAHKRELAIFGSQAKARQLASQYSSLRDALVDLTGDEQLDAEYLDAAVDFLLSISPPFDGPEPIRALTTVETRRLTFIKHVCGRKMKPSTFQMSWDSIDRRPDPGPTTTRLRIA